MRAYHTRINSCKIHGQILFNTNLIWFVQFIYFRLSLKSELLVRWIELIEKFWTRCQFLNNSKELLPLVWNSFNCSHKAISHFKYRILVLLLFLKQYVSHLTRNRENTKLKLKVEIISKNYLFFKILILFV